MTARTFHLTDSEATILQSAELSSKNGSFRTRCQAVRLYALGYSVPAIQTVTGCSRTRLLEWCALYRQTGFDALRDHRVGGNRAMLTTDQRTNLRQRLHQTVPRSAFGSDAATPDGPAWTIPDLRCAVQHWYGVTYASVTSDRTLCAPCGFSYQRPTTVFKARNARTVLDWEAQIEKTDRRGASGPRNGHCGYG